MKKVVTALQRKNAEFVRDKMWPSIPPQNVFLGTFNSDYWDKRKSVFKPTCKTIACFGGWVALNPYFQSLGVYASHYGAPCMRLEIRQRIISHDQVALELFGDSSLFNERFDDEEVGTRALRSDHYLVARRINHLIENSKVQ